MNFEVSIFRNDEHATIPQYQTSGSCAFDLSTIEDAIIQPGEIVRLRTGLIICTPKNYTLLIAARSSLPKKYGLCIPQGFGIVDQDYCGEKDEILLQLYNFTNTVVSVKKGDRLAQGMFVPIIQATFLEIEKVEQKNRGGFGSTG